MPFYLQCSKIWHWLNQPSKGLAENFSLQKPAAYYHTFLSWKVYTLFRSKKDRTFCFPPESHTGWTKWDLHLYRKNCFLFSYLYKSRLKGVKEQVFHFIVTGLKKIATFIYLQPFPDCIGVIMGSVLLSLYTWSSWCRQLSWWSPFFLSVLAKPPSPAVVL